MDKNINTEIKLCVIAKTPWENGGRSLQTSSFWTENPYGDDFAVVPADMVSAILETEGFCDIELNEDGTEVVSFTARQIPVFPEPIETPTKEEELEARLTYVEMMTGLLEV